MRVDASGKVRRKITECLMISFVLELKGDERIDKDDLWSCISFIISTVAGRMGLYMERSGLVRER